MKAKRLGLVGIGVTVVSTAGAILLRSEEATAYRTVTVERGAVEDVVTSTGALQAIETVEVGTQVSGQIAELLVVQSNADARTMADMEREAIRRTLADVGGNRRMAAERLQIGVRTLYEKLKRYELE